jgi:hypothetical protein
MTKREIWEEVAMMSIQRQGETDEMNFAVITDTIGIELGEYNVEGIALLNGGRIMSRSPEEDGTITFECYPVEVGTHSGTTGLGVLDLKYGKAAAANPQIITSKLNYNKIRVAFLWTTDVLSKVSAAVATTSGQPAKRFAFADVFVTNVEPDFSEKKLKYTVTGKVGVRDKQGNDNYLFESTTGAGTTLLAALNNYTTAVKFRS